MVSYSLRTGRNDRKNSPADRSVSIPAVTEHSFGQQRLTFPKTPGISQPIKGLSRCCYVEKFFTKCAIIRPRMNINAFTGCAGESCFLFHKPALLHFLLSSS